MVTRRRSRERLSCRGATGLLRRQTMSFDPPSGPNESLPDIDVLWNYGDPAATEAAMRRILPAAHREGSDDYRAQLLTQIARCQVLQRRFDDGHATLDEAFRLLSEQTPIASIRYRLERGRAWNDVD